MSRKQLNLTHVEYWESDGGYIYAYVVLSGAMFRISDQKESGNIWEWLAPDGPVWDAAHQAIYRNHRWDSLNPERIATLPPLPEQVPEEQLPAARSQQVFEPVDAASFPLLAELIRTGSTNGLLLFAVLHEDTYESVLGDGKFAYLRAVFLDPAEAEAECARLSQKNWSNGHLRRVTLMQEGERILVSNFERNWFDHATIADIIEKVEKQLASSSDNANISDS